MGSGTYTDWTINLDGASGGNGSSGTSGQNGSSGTSGIAGSSGTSGQNGGVGSSGTSGQNGSSGTSGQNGSSGTSGLNGSSGTSGQNGSSGTSGQNGSSGTSGQNGSSGTSGQNGSSGTSGQDGGVGSSGTSGQNGSSGTSGTGFSTITTPFNKGVVLSNGTTNAAYVDSNVFVTGSNLYANAFFQNSKRDLKTNITPFTGSAVDLINQVEIVNFNYKNDIDTTHIGFIADDTPVELSTINQNTMDVPSAVGLLIKAVQELNDEIIKLKNK